MNNKYGNVYVTLCYDSGIVRDGNCYEGYYCQVYNDSDFTEELDSFCLASGYDIPDMSDEAIEFGIRSYLDLI